MPMPNLIPPDFDSSFAKRAFMKVVSSTRNLTSNIQQRSRDLRGAPQASNRVLATQLVARTQLDQAFETAKTAIDEDDGAKLNQIIRKNSELIGMNLFSKPFDLLAYAIENHKTKSLVALLNCYTYHKLDLPESRQGEKLANVALEKNNLKAYVLLMNQQGIDLFDKDSISRYNLNKLIKNIDDQSLAKFLVGSLKQLSNLDTVNKYNVLELILKSKKYDCLKILAEQGFPMEYPLLESQLGYKSPLQLAVKIGNPKIFDLILSKTSPTRLNDSFNKNKETALHMAAQSENLYAINKLIEAKVDLNKTDANGDTALKMTLDPVIFKTLIDAGANVNLAGEQHKNFFEQAAEDDQLNFLYYRKYIILEKNFLTPLIGKKLLEKAILAHDKHLIEKLAQKNISINTKDKDPDKTPNIDLLEIAMGASNSEIIKQLIDDVDGAIDPAGRDFNHLYEKAFITGNFEINEALVNAGFKYNHEKNDLQKTLTYKALKESQPKVFSTNIQPQITGMLQHPRLAARLYDEHNNSLAHIAAKDGDVQVLNRLVNCGVNFNHTNVSGETPLHIALKAYDSAPTKEKKNQLKECIDLLVHSYDYLNSNLASKQINSAADFNTTSHQVEYQNKRAVDLNQLDASGNSAANYLIEHLDQSKDPYFLKILLMLKTRGADLNLQSDTGKSVQERLDKHLVYSTTTQEHIRSSLASNHKFKSAANYMLEKAAKIPSDQDFHNSFLDNFIDDQRHRNFQKSNDESGINTMMVRALEKMAYTFEVKSLNTLLEMNKDKLGQLLEDYGTDLIWFTLDHAADLSRGKLLGKKLEDQTLCLLEIYKQNGLKFSGKHLAISAYATNKIKNYIYDTIENQDFEIANKPQISKAYQTKLQS
jgi:ankyrin repeat protein